MNIKMLAVGTALSIGMMAGFAVDSYAGPVTGTLNMAGGVQGLNGGAGGTVTPNWVLADYVDFAGPFGGGTGGFTVVDFGVTTGDFAQFIGQTGTIKDFSFESFSPQNNFYTISYNGSTLSFDLETLSIDSRNVNGLVLSGTGTISLTGFDTTEGVWSFSTQAVGGTTKFSWSSTTVPVPEPMTLGIIGAGLVAAGLLRRRSSV